MNKILFLCTGNSCRSQMAEAWTNQLRKDSYKAYSAGIAPKGVDPRATKVMAEVGVDISAHSSKDIDSLGDMEFDYVITLCDNANESCPFFPAKTKLLHRGFDDPPKLTEGIQNEEESLNQYRRVRDKIKAFVENIEEENTKKGGIEMSETAKNINWKGYSIVSIVLMFGIILVSIFTRLWVITAIPIGFLFGFFLKKGELCGASAMSEVILMRDRSKIFGLWIAIVVSMVLFAAFDLMGLINLNPKPFIYLNYIVGGILFGIGIVLAGGCVSGCLFKAGAGNINSMAGLMGIPLGIAIVEHGYLNTFHNYMKGFVIKTQEGTSITISSITGIPYWLLVIIFVAATIFIIFIKRKKNTKDNTDTPDNTGFVTGAIQRPWRPWKAGLAIGILAIFAYLSSASTGRNYPLGVTHGVLHVQMLFTENNLTYAYKKPETKNITNNQVKSSKIQAGSKDTAAAVPQSKGKKVNVWLMLLITSLVIGSWVSGRFSGTIEFKPRPPSQTVVAFIGGLLLGSGAAFATGCVIGNILSGLALMSVGNILFAVVVLLTNWVTTYFYLMGGKVSDFVSNE